MGKYKLCPGCKRRNETNVLECPDCETDLTAVRITDDDRDREQQKQNGNHSLNQPLNQPLNHPLNHPQDCMAEPEYIRLCECGCPNPVSAAQCLECGELIGDIVPTVKEQSEHTGPVRPVKPAKPVLAMLEGTLEYELPDGEVIIGREYALGDYLADKLYVSRRHAIISRTDGQVWIENLSNTNATYVNNHRITRLTLLEEGDEIGLGGNGTDGTRQQQAAYFMLRCRPCT